MSTLLHKVGNHRLYTLNGDLVLSKNGIMQYALTPIGDNHFDEAATRLDAYYAKHGDDFLADASFVRYIIFGGE